MARWEPMIKAASFSRFGCVPWASHGFRMPLFILISGFFTAMLWCHEWPGLTFGPVDGGGLICQLVEIHGI